MAKFVIEARRIEKVKRIISKRYRNARGSHQRWKANMVKEYRLKIQINSLYG